ncbi:hypothetical protein F4779DRAFT_615304 [Xylariaceae sp. FL0662B]|nr:hypothetical protein F4779DRAFT_615304 [Xylariaceae sp. FL0662B]
MKYTIPKGQTEAKPTRAKPTQTNPPRGGLRGPATSDTEKPDAGKGWERMAFNSSRILVETGGPSPLKVKRPDEVDDAEIPECHRPKE